MGIGRTNINCIFMSTLLFYMVLDSWRHLMCMTLFFPVINRTPTMMDITVQVI